MKTLPDTFQKSSMSHSFFGVRRVSRRFRIFWIAAIYCRFRVTPRPVPLWERDTSRVAGVWRVSRRFGILESRYLPTSFRQIEKPIHNPFAVQKIVVLIRIISIRPNKRDTVEPWRSRVFGRYILQKDRGVHYGIQLLCCSVEVQAVQTGKKYR